MARVLVTRPLTEGGTDPLLEAGHEIVLLRQDGTALPRDELARAAAEFDGIVSHLTDRIDTAVLESGRSGRLRVVANAAVGYDNIDVVSATALGITVCNTPGVLDDTTADLAFLLILTATRLASDAERDLREGRWTGWGFGTHLARDVHGATLGLVGFGRIARAVAQRAEGFNMGVIHTTRHDTGVTGFVSTLDELLERSDIVSLHVPLTESTRHLIGAAELDRMKPTAVLVNTARGPVVDEDALVDALESGSIYAAGLDVFDGEPAVNPRLLPRTPDDAASSHRECNYWDADAHGAPGLPGRVRRAGGAHTSQRRRAGAVASLATTVPLRVWSGAVNRRGSNGTIPGSFGGLSVREGGGGGQDPGGFYCCAYGRRSLHAGKRSGPIRVSRRSSDPSELGH